MRNVKNMVVTLVMAVVLCGVPVHASAASAASFIQADQGVGQKSYNSFMAYGAMLPAGVQSALNKYGYTVYMSTDDWDSLMAYDQQKVKTMYPDKNIVFSNSKKAANTTGVTKYLSRTIYIKYDAAASYADEYGVDNTEFTFFHEVGHAVDDMSYMEENETTMHSDTRSDEEDFLQIYNAEKDASSVRKYAAGSNREYFADAFARYMIDGASLQKDCPQTYQFIADCISNYMH